MVPLLVPDKLHGRPVAAFCPAFNQGDALPIVHDVQRLAFEAYCGSTRGKLTMDLEAAEIAPLLGRLRRMGIEVVIFLAPYHPDAYSILVRPEAPIAGL